MRHQVEVGVVPLPRRVSHLFVHFQARTVRLGSPNSVGPRNLLAVMGASIYFQNVVIEVLNSQAQPCDAQVANSFELVIGERARLGLERYFFRFIPGQQRLHRLGQML